MDFESRRSDAAAPPPRVLALLDYYLPGHRSGGPLRSVSNLIESLGREFDFRVVTRNRDLNDAAPYPGIRAGEWVALGRGHVCYLEPGWRAAWRLMQLLRREEFDLVYINSFFSRCFSMLPVWLTALGLVRQQRILLAPRGEFSPGALSLKRKRKLLYLLLIHLLPAYRRVVWHASSDFEAAEIRTVIGPDSKVRRALPLSGHLRSAPKVLTALDMPMALTGPWPPEPCHKRPSHIEVAFLSRISAKKNLHGALEILAGVRGSLDFYVYGPVEDEAYWAHCNELIGKLPPSIHVHYQGSLPHDRVLSALAQHDLFFLPTLGENYGHVIHEALLAACPVLISDRTPWRGLEELGVGWDVPLENPDIFRRRFEECIRISPEEFARLSRRARNYGVGRSSDSSVLEDNRQLLLKSLREAACVSG